MQSRNHGWQTYNNRFSRKGQTSLPHGPFIACRHATPDRSWVQPMARRTLVDDAWWRNLSPKEKEQIRNGLWMTGRMTLY